jgi:hypothetical protein
MNAKEITIIILLSVGGIAAGVWLRGYSDEKQWTSHV